jgi:AhpD family alkylhydroperoxidase
MELHIHGTEVMNDLVPLARDFRHAAPDVMKAFGELHRATMSPGALDTKTKELIALAISVSKVCDGCIASHAKGAAKAGATEAEMAEALGVAVLMNGGPATVYGPRALSAFRDFAGGVAT